MKMVENAYKTFQFSKEMISEGKVFENKYKNYPEKLKKEITSHK